jgi:hypothetical protein
MNCGLLKRSRTAGCGVAKGRAAPKVVGISCGMELGLRAASKLRYESPVGERELG